MCSQLPPKRSNVLPIVFTLIIFGFFRPIQGIENKVLIDTFAIPAEDNKTTEISHENTTLKLKTQNGIESFSISQFFANFLGKNESFLKHWGNNYQDCYEECFPSIEDIRKLQRRFGARSLLELYFYLSATDECFCVNNESENLLDFDWPFDFWRSNLKNNHPITGLQTDGNLKASLDWNQNSVCIMENAIYLIIKLVQEFGITDLSSSQYSSNYICKTWFCGY